MSSIQKILLVTGILLILVIGTVFAVIWHRFVREPLYTGVHSTTILMLPGKGVDYLAKELAQRNLLSHPKFFIWLAKVSGDADRLKAGEYEIKPRMTPIEILSNIAAGRVYQRNVTFIEGKTFEDMKQTLNSNPYLKHDILNLSDAQIMQQLRYPGQNPEGLFFPATYNFTWGDNDLMLLKEAYLHMQSILNNEWAQRASDLPYQNPYEALIVASLIEKETALPEERAQIAGVIVRRLQKHMKLQIDPTILYGLKLSPHAVITKINLATDTPYNTYRHYGLPPTPIDMPSRASILAALHPDGGDTFYYVAKGDGSHIFSATYQQHRQASIKYVEKPNVMAWLLPACWVHPPLLRQRNCF